MQRENVSQGSRRLPVGTLIVDKFGIKPRVGINFTVSVQLLQVFIHFIHTCIKLFFTWLLTSLLTPWCRVLLEQLTGLQLVKKFPAFHGTPKVHHRTHKRPPPVSILGQPKPVHIPTSHLLEIHLNIIHPSTPRSPQWLFPERLWNLEFQQIQYINLRRFVLLFYVSSATNEKSSTHLITWVLKLNVTNTATCFGLIYLSYKTVCVILIEVPVFTVFVVCAMYSNCTLKWYLK